MLNVVGGSYLEVCHSPYWRQVYGSGGRAAAAISHMCGRTRLYTCIGKRRVKDLEGLAANFNFELKPLITMDTVSFEYSHGLSAPVIRPAVHTWKTRQKIQVKGDSILRYGMIEADPVVKGGRVVYDPQSVFDPELFSANGSTADRLAVVLNTHEGKKLTRRTDSGEIARAVLALFHADVVVLKQGSIGALVVTRNGRKHLVPAYETKSVFPIGSGDVFSAAFAAKWAVRKDDAVSAAQYASLAAAYYCSTRTLPLPSKFTSSSKSSFGIGQATRKSRTTRKLVYLAGPFFHAGQRWLIEEAKVALEGQGLRVFSPFHDVGIGSAHHVVPEDLRALNKADIVFAIVDGLDAGTLFEIGYARSRGIPVVALAEQEGEESLKLLEGSGCCIEKDFTTSVYKTSWCAGRIR